MPPTIQADAAISTLAQTIQLSLAPVFLLSGIAAFISVLNTRLLRVVDRTRFLQGEGATGLGVDRRELEISILLKRRYWINQSITLCTYSALLVAGVVALLFVGAMFHADVTIFVAVLFVGAMATLIAGLLGFLREVHMAVRLMPPLGEMPLIR